MPKKTSKPFTKRVLKRYAEMLLRHIHQCGGRDRYVSVEEIEDALGLEAWLVLRLCRTHLRADVHVARRAPVRLADSGDFQSTLEREWMRCLVAEPHVRIRPCAVRLTEKELLRPKKRPRRSKRKSRKQRSIAVRLLWPGGLPFRKISGIVGAWLTN